MPDKIRRPFLNKYLLADLMGSYKISGNYNLNFSLKNIFDKNYENSLDYSGTPRTMNISLRKAF